jgi:hypothetical protein
MTQNGSREIMAMGWEQTNDVPNTYPNTSAALTSSQSRQYSLTNPLSIATILSPDSSWTMNDSLQTCPPYNPEQCNQSPFLQIGFDAFQIAPTISYVPSMEPSSHHAPIAFASPPGLFVPPAETMSPMTVQGSYICNVAPPINKHDVVVNQIGATIAQDNEISQGLVAATALGTPTIDPDETVCFGVVSRP